MKQPIILIAVLLAACNKTPKPEEAQESIKSDAVAVQELPADLVEQELESKQELYLNGIYEFDYPHDTEGMNENQYIAFKKDDAMVQAWYFGTSDEFDEAREGYLPGYFVSKINDLKTKGDSIFFSISTGFNQCYSTRFPIGFIDSTKINKDYTKWFATGEDQTIKYSAKVDGLKLYLNRFGETRTYRKTRNYFHLGIDNYDTTKCSTEPLLAIDRNLENLTEQIVIDFLSSFSVICEANVEFGEWSNELLFKILLTNPELTLKVLANHLNQLDTVSIYEALESPIHDLIPMDSITSRIESLNIDEDLKKSVLGRLENLK